MNGIREPLGGLPKRKETKSPVAIEKTQEMLLYEKYFKGNEQLLKDMRSLMYGLPVSDEAKQLIKSTFADDILFGYVRKRFYPSLADDTQIGVVSDIWLGAEQMVFNMNATQIRQAVEYKQRSLDMTLQALTLLRDPFDGIDRDLNLSFVASEECFSKDPLQIELLARNMYIRHVDKQLSMIFILSNKDQMSQADIQKRLDMNSAQ